MQMVLLMLSLNNSLIQPILFGADQPSILVHPRLVGDMCDLRRTIKNLQSYELVIRSGVDVGDDPKCRETEQKGEFTGLEVLDGGEGS